MTLIPNLNEIHCFVPCEQSKINSGLCSCINRTKNELNNHIYKYNIKKGDEFICNETINNIFGMPLFIKDQIYTVLGIDEPNNDITLDHILYGCEYGSNSIEYILSKFTKK